MECIVRDDGSKAMECIVCHDALTPNNPRDFTGRAWPMHSRSHGSGVNWFDARVMPQLRVVEDEGLHARCNFR